jgi:hypothetical protein
MSKVIYTKNNYRENILRYHRQFDPDYKIPDDHEVHHIVPISEAKKLGWKESDIHHPQNLMVVTREEHIILHEQRGDKWCLNFLKLHSLDNTGKNNPMFGIRGKDHPLYGKKMKEEHIKRGKDHPMYGKSPWNKDVTGIFCGVKSHRFKGSYHTPFGVFYSINEIRKKTLPVTCSSIFRWCKNCDKTISVNAYIQTKYFHTIGSKEDITNKTFREVGFWFENV